MFPRRDRFRRPNTGATLLAAGAMLLAVAAGPARSVAAPQAPAATTLSRFPSTARIQDVRQYIRRTWRLLTRSTRDLPRAAPDSKVQHAAGDPWPVYVAADEDRAAIARTLHAVLPPGEVEQIDL